MNHEGGSFTFDFYLPAKKKENTRKESTKGKGKAAGKGAKWQPVQAAQSSYFAPIQEDDEEEDPMEVGMIDMGFHGQEWR